VTGLEAFIDIAILENASYACIEAANAVARRNFELPCDRLSLFRSDTRN